MKKRVLILFTALLCVLALVACSKDPEMPGESGDQTEQGGNEGGSNSGSGDSDNEDEAPHEHAWSTWSMTTPATCVAKGEEKRTCACGEIEKREIPVTKDHSYSFQGICTVCKEFNMKAVMISTEHYNFTVGMMSYMVYTQYRNLLAIYDQFPPGVHIGGGPGGTVLDRSKPLREQIYATHDNNLQALAEPKTWFDHFAEMSEENVKEILAVCEEAYDANIKLSDFDLREIDADVDAMRDCAVKSSVSLEDYIVSQYGENVKEEDVRAAMEVVALASKYSSQKSDEIYEDVTDEAIRTEYEANASEYDDHMVRFVGHILFQTETYQGLITSEGLSGPIKELADRVLTKNLTLSAELMAKELLLMMREEEKVLFVQDGDKTYYAMDEQEFKRYGEKYSEDLFVFYDGVSEGEMIEGLDTWLFDDARVEGEISFPAPIATDYGYHIILYRGDEMLAWQYEIRENLASEAYHTWISLIQNSTVYTYGHTVLWNLIEG